MFFCGGRADQALGVDLTGLVIDVPSVKVRRKWGLFILTDGPSLRPIASLALALISLC